MADVVLDACTLIDLERGDRRTELWIEEAVARGVTLLVAARRTPRSGRATR
jgi:hypothetical protein